MTYFEGNVDIINFCTNHTNRFFQEISAIIRSEIDNVNKFDQITTAVYRA